jgi:hypothetical protein
MGEETQYGPALPDMAWINRQVPILELARGLAARGKSRHVTVSIDGVICKKILQYGRTGIKC